MAKYRHLLNLEVSIRVCDTILCIPFEMFHNFWKFFFFFKWVIGEFPGCLVATILGFHCCGLGSIPDGRLRPCKPCGMAKKKRKEKKMNNKCNKNRIMLFNPNQVMFLYKVWTFLNPGSVPLLKEVFANVLRSASTFFLNKQKDSKESNPLILCVNAI